MAEKIDQAKDMYASLDNWLGKFALAPHAPPPPSPHTMAIDQEQIQDEGIEDVG